MDSGVARQPITDMARAIARALAGRLDPTSGLRCSDLRAACKANPAAHRLRRGRGGEGHPRRDRLPRQRLRHADPDRPRGARRETMQALGSSDADGHRDPQRAGARTRNAPIRRLVYERLQRNGTCAATASAWSTRTATSSPPDGGAGRRRRAWSPASPAASPLYGDVQRVIDASPAGSRSGYSIMRRAGTARCSSPTPRSTSARAPRNWPNRHRGRGRRADGPRAARGLAVLLQLRQPTSTARTASARPSASRRGAVDFEYDGEMQADMALDPDSMATYPFCRLTGPANVLIMPALHSAHISRA